MSIAYGILLQQPKLKKGTQEERDKEKREMEMSYDLERLQKGNEMGVKSEKLQNYNKKGEEHSRLETNVNTDKMIAIFPGTQLRLSNFFQGRYMVGRYRTKVQDSKSLLILIHRMPYPSSLFFPLVLMHDSVL